jgi:hypothetical protein
VVDKYLVTALSIVKNIPSENKTTLYDTIISSLDYRRRMINEMKSTLNQSFTDLNYFKLMYDACDVYIGFAKKINSINEKEFSEWKTVIEKAIVNKEIKSDTDIDFIANNFMLLPQGLGLKNSFNGSLEINELKSMYLKFYSLLKI